MTKKSEVLKYSPGTAEYVVMHARYQRSRGRAPSATFAGISNPREALAYAKKVANIPYLSGGFPAAYTCRWCGATGCKLWVHFQIFTSGPGPLCTVCVGKFYRIDTSTTGESEESICGYFPAVPVEDKGGHCENSEYWWFTEIPTHGLDWWKRLPTFAEAKQP